jgi:hypothetical protein
MSEETKTVIIDVQVENTKLEKAEKLLESNKRARAELNNEIKKSNVVTDEQIKKRVALNAEQKKLTATRNESIKNVKAETGSLNALRLQLSKQVKERNNLNKSTVEGAKKFQELQTSISGLNAEISGFEEAGGDFRRNVGNYPDLLGAADTATGGFISTLTGLLNPLTAVAVGMAAVGAAYVKTGRGSADLARAQDRLSTAFNDVGNSIADLVTDKNGGGIIDEFLRDLQFRFLGVASTLRSDVIVAVKEMIREFELAQIDSDRLAKTQLDAAEKQRQIRDEERNSLKERREANEELGLIIRERESEQIATQLKQISNLETLLKIDEGNLDLQIKLKQAEFELADIREEATGFLSEQRINELALAREGSQARTDLLKAELQEQLILSEEGSKESFLIRKQIIDESLALELEAVGNNILARNLLEQEANNELLLLEKEFAKSKEALKEKEKEKSKDNTAKFLQDLGTKTIKDAEAVSKKTIALAEAEADAKESLQGDLLSSSLNLLGEAFGANKAAASITAGINTFEGVTKALAAAPPPFNFVLAGLTAAAGAVQIGKINSTQPPAGISSSGSSSAPSISVPSSSAGGLAGVNASLLSQFSNEPSAASNNAQNVGLAVGNNFPVIEVAVTEINTVNNSLNVKVTEASLG